MRNERYRKNAVSVRERHNERKNEVYSNPDVLLEYSRNNVTFKACEAATYAQQFDRMVEEGVVSTRGLKPDAYVFDELVFDVNTDYFETHGAMSTPSSSTPRCTSWQRRSREENSTSSRSHARRRTQPGSQ